MSYLPEELGRIVNAYAKPAFVHWRLFKDAKQVVPKRHWDNLKEALSGPNAEHVRETLVVYLEAVRAHDRSAQDLYDYQSSIGDPGSYTENGDLFITVLPPEEQTKREELCEVILLAQSQEYNAYRALVVQIHAKGLTMREYDEEVNPYA
jgi:hypothetical protein